MKVLNTAAEIGGIRLNTVNYPYGAEHYLKTGEVLPDSAVKEFRNFSAMYFGAAGDPRVKPGILELDFLLKMRFELDQYINLRPIKNYPNVPSPLALNGNIDFYVVRENTEDLYNGMGSIFRSNGSADSHRCVLSMERQTYKATANVDISLGKDDDFAVNLGLISRTGAERCIKYAFEFAKAKGRRKLTCVDKCNAVKFIYGLWREVFEDVAKEYPDIETECNYVDAAAMWFVNRPESFDVVVVPNLFGDILTDLGAAISGGLGFSAGANINPNGVSMFEPIHGSAPKYKGQNTINPIATILSGAMLLENIGQPELAKLVDDAVRNVLHNGTIRTRDIGGTSSTSEVGDAVAAEIIGIAKSLR